MFNLNSIMIGSHHPKALGEFYAKVFQKDPDMAEGDWYGWQLGSVHFSVGAHSEIKGDSKEPQRILINFESNDVKGEFDRIKEFASVIKEAYEMEGWEGGWIATLADPDGNYFQLMTPWTPTE